MSSWYAYLGLYVERYRVGLREYIIVHGFFVSVGDWAREVGSVCSEVFAIATTLMLHMMLAGSFFDVNPSW